MGGDIGDSVSSSDINETAASISVKVPQRLLGSETSAEGAAEDGSAFTRIEAKFVDVPGHYNFKP